MRSRSVVRFLLVAVTLVFCSLPGAAQNESIWQKLKKSAKQQGQTAAQQGTQQVQQVQQQVQQQLPVVGGQANQMVPQSPCGSLTGAGAAGTGVTYTGGPGGGAGSCGPTCFDAGPFSAAVTQMTMSQQGYWHIIRMNLQFHNASNQPLIIAYREGSMVMVDNLGNTYQAAGGNPGPVQGIGIDRGSQTDSQFVLGPGQTGNAMFSVARSRGNDSAIGTGFAYNFTVDELQPQNGAQAIALRQYNLNFPAIAPGSSNAAFPAATSPSVVPASSIVTATGKGAAIGGAAVPTVRTTGGVAVNGPSSVTPTATSPAVVPRSRRGVVNQATTRPTVSVPNATPAAQVNHAPVANAALKTAAMPPPKPAVPAKPIPAKTTSTKSTAAPTITGK